MAAVTMCDVLLVAQSDKPIDYYLLNVQSPLSFIEVFCSILKLALVLQPQRYCFDLL